MDTVCSQCNSIEIYKFHYKLKLCMKCFNKRWWNTYKDKCNSSDSRKKSKLEWDMKNKQLLKQRDRDRYLRNKVQILAKKRERRSIILEQDNKRYCEDIQYRLRTILRKRLYHAIKKDHKTGSAVSDLGCSIEELKIYLESKFQPGMIWENQGKKGWHIDHIIPLSSFDLTNREQLLKACHYTNLQPLWAADNFRKGVNHE